MLTISERGYGKRTSAYEYRVTKRGGKGIESMSLGKGNADAAMIAAFPVLLARYRSGSALTRHVVAVGQMLMGGLFIHLTGGRIETHFHVFGSLALLAFYRDWRVLVTASLVVAGDHHLRGQIWPRSI